MYSQMKRLGVLALLVVGFGAAKEIRGEDCLPPTPPPCAADGICRPSGPYGYNVKRWRPWPLDPATEPTAADEPGEEDQRPLQPLELPPEREEDLRGTYRPRTKERKSEEAEADDQASPAVPVAPLVPEAEPAEVPGLPPAEVPGLPPAEVPGLPPAEVPGLPPAEVPGLPQDEPPQQLRPPEREEPPADEDDDFPFDLEGNIPAAPELNDNPPQLPASLRRVRRKQKVSLATYTRSANPPDPLSFGRDRHVQRASASGTKAGATSKRNTPTRVRLIEQGKKKVSSRTSARR